MGYLFLLVSHRYSSKHSGWLPNGMNHYNSSYCTISSFSGTIAGTYLVHFKHLLFGFGWCSCFSILVNAVSRHNGSSPTWIWIGSIQVLLSRWQSSPHHQRQRLKLRIFFHYSITTNSILLFCYSSKSSSLVTGSFSASWVIYNMLFVLGCIHIIFMFFSKLYSSHVKACILCHLHFTLNLWIWFCLNFIIIN